MYLQQSHPAIVIPQAAMVVATFLSACEHLVELMTEEWLMLGNRAGGVKNHMHGSVHVHQHLLNRKLLLDFSELRQDAGPKNSTPHAPSSVSVFGLILLHARLTPAAG